MPVPPLMHKSPAYTPPLPIQPPIHTLQTASDLISNLKDQADIYGGKIQEEQRTAGELMRRVEELQQRIAGVWAPPTPTPPMQAHHYKHTPHTTHARTRNTAHVHAC
jgi:hypothetical protein